MKSVVGALKLELSQYEEVSRFSRFGTEVNEATKRQIERGQRLDALLRQGPHKPIKMEDQVMLILALTTGFMDNVKPENVAKYSGELLEYLYNHAANLVDQIRYHRELSEDTKTELLREFSLFIAQREKKEKRKS